MPIGKSLDMSEEDVEGTVVEKTPLASASPKMQWPMPFAANLSLSLIMAFATIVLCVMIMLLLGGLIYGLIIATRPFLGGGERA